MASCVNGEDCYALLTRDVGIAFADLYDGGEAENCRSGRVELLRMYRHERFSDFFEVSL